MAAWRDPRMDVNFLVTIPADDVGSGNWTIEEVLLDEPSQFYNRRVEAQIQNWFPRLSVENSLQPFRWLFEYLWNEYRYSRIRIYFQHNETFQLNRVQLGSERRNFELVRDNVINAEHIDRLAMAVFQRMQQMAAQYSDLDDNELANYVIVVDIFVRNDVGFCGTGIFPDYFPLYISDQSVYNPVGPYCYYKCLFYHENKRAPQNDSELLEWVKKYPQLPPVQQMQEGMVYTEFLDKLASIWPNRQFVVIDVKIQVKYATPLTAETNQFVCLILSGRHYYYVRNLVKLVSDARPNESGNFLCITCGSIQPRYMHTCRRKSDVASCPKCNRHFANKYQKNYHFKVRYDQGREFEICPGCGGKDFVSKVCFNYHKRNCLALKSMTDKMKKKIHCQGCGLYYYPDEDHTCYFDKMTMADKEKYPDGIYVFDFESMFSKPDDGDSTQLHTVNYVVVKKLFDSEFSQEFNDMDNFITWIDEMASSKVLIIAHNFRGYDGRLLLVDLLKHKSKDQCHSMIMVGSKINTFQYGKITFSDSLLHIATALDNFPKIFGLQLECKGFFPYDFNTLENQNYCGAIPSIEVFRPNKMSKGRRDKFLAWYDENKDIYYNFREQMRDYCHLDVEILKQGLEVYIKSAKAVNQNINPLESFTVASAAYRIWRTLHMPEKVIAYYGAAFHEAARNALRGGRTDVRCMYKKWSPEQVFVHKQYGVYADVQSMYPYIQMTKPMPVGKPYRHINPKYTPGQYFGIVKCTLDPPPTFQYHPAICIRDNETDRLCAPLKQLVNIFITTNELDQAINQGYKILKIDFIDHYDQSTSLFKDYIRKFLKIKVEKSQNYPGDAKFQELDQLYSSRCGIKLERNNFENNPGLKQIAKLYLNSLWGKLCEKAKYDFNCHVDEEDFLRMEEEEEDGIYDAKLKMKIHDNSYLIRGTYKTQNHIAADMKNRQKTSPAIGAFITMYGRAMLLEQMQKLGKRALYHDTDSIVYDRHESLYNIPLGKCLGDWEDELSGKPIVEFVALAPKTYSYRYLDDPVPMTTDLAGQPYWEWQNQKYPIKEVTKIKGVRQCFDTPIDFDTLLKLVKREQQQILTEQIMFLWNLRKMQMRTKWGVKMTSFNYGKGLLGANYLTYPPGTEQYWDDTQQQCEQGDPLKL